MSNTTFNSLKLSHNLIDGSSEVIVGICLMRTVDDDDDDHRYSMYLSNLLRLVEAGNVPVNLKPLQAKLMKPAACVMCVQ